MKRYKSFHEAATETGAVYRHHRMMRIPSCVCVPVQGAYGRLITMDMVINDDRTELIQLIINATCGYGETATTKSNPNRHKSIFPAAQSWHDIWTKLGD